jgi:probable phosphoglycerate mutase
VSFPELFILRHGETEWNVEGRLQGSLDSALTDRGQAQAKAQRRILERVSLDGAMCWCSPQGRALETARLALTPLGLAIQQDVRLVEIGVGAWTGLRRDDIRLTAPFDEFEMAGFSLYERAPGGEGFQALRRRCAAFLDDIARRGAPAVVVTHGITSRILRLILLDMDICEIADVEGGQGVVFHIKDGASTRLSLQDEM